MVYLKKQCSPIFQGFFARHSEMMEQTDALQNMAENLKPLNKVGSFVQHFLD